MKIKKLSFLSIILIIGLLLFIPNTVNAVDKVHADIKIDGSNIIPIIGETPYYLTINPAEYEIELEEWYDDKGDKFTTTFEAGKTYIYRLVLTPKTEFGWDATSTLTINNINWTKPPQYTVDSTGKLSFMGYISPVEGCKITVNSEEGVIYGQDGPLAAPKGFNRNLRIIAEEGYKITSVKVNGVEQTLPLEDERLTFNNIQEDINVVVEAVKQINLFEDSIHQEFIKGTDKALTFTLNHNNRCYGKVFIDGVELNETNGDYGWRFVEGIYPSIALSEDYLKTLKVGKHTIKFVIDRVGEAETSFEVIERKSELKQINFIWNTDNQKFVKETDKNLLFILDNDGGYGKVFVDGVELDETKGDYLWDHDEWKNPSIHLSEEYMKTLELGKHTIKFVIDNVGEAETTFTIVEPEDKENNKDDDKGNVPSNDSNNTNNENVTTEENNSNNPQTGDNIMLYVVILGISIIGIVVTTIVRKKSQNN